MSRPPAIENFLATILLRRLDITLKVRSSQKCFHNRLKPVTRHPEWRDHSQQQELGTDTGDSGSGGLKSVHWKPFVL